MGIGGYLYLVWGTFRELEKDNPCRATANTTRRSLIVHWDSLEEGSFGMSCVSRVSCYLGS